MAQPRRAFASRNGDDVSALDRRIIEQLKDDGRRPFTQIASDLGVSEAAVRARTNRLVERGVLQIVGVTDPLKLGYDQIAMVGVRCEPGKRVEAADRIAELPEVGLVVAVAGSFDLLIEAICEDSEALLVFLNEKLGRIEGVRDCEAFPYLRMVKQVYQWGAH